MGNKKLFCITFAKVGTVEMYADSEEEARREAEDIPDNDIFWGDTCVTDSEEIEKES